ncbi:UDP-glucuronosyl and UDP-glucosyl transferase [Handroanthus impetiginosus]|uniref:Glycosyltransferase n=1 Tax=Handroanthus impetiginosus TaxID=429701 RepID=A0A2G9GBP6_9LAMI|nr:UDP-glucuronosyl and UDP-glucosyl transferase [Handroanthus impetiginosus]
MSKGHTIPLLHLAHLLLRRGAAVTIFTTPLNHPFISHSLPQTNVSIIDLPFPENIPEIQPGIESTDKFPSMSLFVPFVNGVKLMQPSFEKALQNITIHSQINCIISDAFLYWTQKSASKFNIPRLSFYGMSYYATALCREVVSNGLLWLHESADEPFTVTGFPWIKLRRNDFDDPFDKLDPRGDHWDFIIEETNATQNSYGILMNTFRELEKPFEDYWAQNCQPKTWSIGPLCLAQLPKNESLDSINKRKWVQWLDEKLAQGSPVLYTAFGSQATLSARQLREIAFGLEEAKVNFLWVLRKNVNFDLIDDGFEERVKGRGIIVKEWVDQKEILEHETVKGFLSHCGWNSVLEGIYAAVPILAWPLMADQYLNAKMVVEEIKVGLRVNTVDRTVKGFVSGESLKKMVVELMEAEVGESLREKAAELAATARKAVADGGSSWSALNELISEVCREKVIVGRSSDRRSHVEPKCFFEN